MRKPPRHDDGMDSQQVTAWVDAYEEGWRAGDTGAVERLFTPPGRGYTADDEG